MTTRISRTVRLTCIAILFGFSGAVFAQTSDSTIRVEVVDGNGQPLANAEVEIIHEPTGSAKTYRSNDSGRAVARGQRVGGPYTIRFPGSSSNTANPINNVFTTVGQTQTIVLTAGGPMEEIRVVGSFTAVETNVGPGSTFNRERLDSTPSLNRDINSLLQQDPRANFDTQNGNLSIAGSNNRYNSLTIDGIRQNDDFGLNLNGSPTNRSPISLDAIESIALNIAPYDVEFGAFQGGNVNVVTKSGTNEFDGTVFYTYSDDNFIGEESDGETLASPNFEETVFGISVGGPIIKDKLFFFASYEESELATPFPLTLGNDDGINSAGEVDVITQAQMDQALQIAASRYNYDGGTFDAANDTSDERLLLKFDLDINDDHRASLTYQNTDGVRIIDDFTFFRNPTFASPSSHRFTNRAELTALSLNVFSDWTDNFSTTFKYSNKEVATDNRSVGADGVGEAHISTLSPNGQSGTIHIGPDHFRHANDLDNDRVTYNLTGTYAVNDDVTLTFGYERDELDTFNQFVPWSKGEFFYNSLDDYENGITSRVAYGNATTLNPLDRVAIFDTTTNVFYIQNEWLATDALTLTFGVRYETVSNGENVVDNPNFRARVGQENTYNFDDESLFLPRFGFEYEIGERTTLRGGAGQFGGGTPNVWLSNSYSQDGIRGTFRTQVNGDFDQNAGIPQVLLDRVAQVNPTTDVDSIAPGTPISSVWKYNLGIEHDLDLSGIGLGDGWNLQADLLVTDVKDAYVWSERRNGTTGVLAPDGRPIREFSFARDMVMSTTDEGSATVVTGQLSKIFDTRVGQWNLYAGYTFQDIEEVNPGARFTAFDTFGSPAHIDTEDQGRGVTYAANTETEHRFTFGVNWVNQWFGDNDTSLTLNYSARSGRNYSYTYQGGGPFGGYGLLGDFSPKLVYIPTGLNDPLVTYGGNIDQNALNAYISGEDCLNAARGRILERNTCQNDWVHRWDLRFSQDFNVSGDHTLQFFLDVENFGNLLNEDWGRYSEFVFNTPLVSASITSDGSQVVYDNFNSAPGQAVYRIPSVWRMQLGFRYSF